MACRRKSGSGVSGCSGISLAGAEPPSPAELHLPLRPASMIWTPQFVMSPQHRQQSVAVCGPPAAARRSLGPLLDGFGLTGSLSFDTLLPFSDSCLLPSGLFSLSDNLSAKLIKLKRKICSSLLQFWTCLESKITICCFPVMKLLVALWMEKRRKLQMMDNPS